MALSGSFTGTTSNQYIQPKITWSAVQSVSGNYSDVTATLTYSRTNSGYTTSGKWSGSITINGIQTIGSSGDSQLYISQNSNTFAMSATVRVYHHDDGTKDVSISATGSISSASLSSTSISGLVTLDTIPRISVPTLSTDRVNFGSNITIYTNRKSTVFKHKLFFRIGNSGWEEITPTASVTDNYTWAVPTSLMNQIPRDTTLLITISCDTHYNGSYLGEEHVSFTAVVPDTVVPTIGNISWTKTSSEPAAWGITQNVSKGTMSMTGVSEAYSSPIKSYSITFAGLSSTTSSLTVDNISSSGTLTAIAKVTDSRGRTSAEKKVDFIVTAYKKPQLTVVAYRCASTSTSGVEDTSGEYLYLKATATVTAVGSNSLKTLTLGYKRHDATGSYETVNITNGTARITALSSNYTWDWVVTATDEASTVTVNGSISTGEVILDILANGKGMSFGKVAEKEGLSSGWDLELPNINATNKLKGATVEGTTGFFTNLTVGGVSSTWVKDAKDYVVEQGTVGMSGTSSTWSYRKWASGIAECWGLYPITGAAINVAWGYLFETAINYQLSFPTGLFVSNPVAHFSTPTATGGVLALETMGETTKVQTCSFFPVRATPSTIDLTVAIQAIGRWK